MKVQGSIAQNINNNDKQEKQHVAFKSGMVGALNASGALMQSIENGGF